MKSRSFALLVLLLAAGGCCTLEQHVYCLTRGHEFPYACPPCPYYSYEHGEWVYTAATDALPVVPLDTKLMPKSQPGD